MRSHVSQAKSYRRIRSVHKFRHNNKGQFVIIAALLIATLTLATAFSIHEINVHRQSIAYRPVDEFLLGTTSDMNRALTYGLKTFTTYLENNTADQNATQHALEFMGQWNKSILMAYSSYGLRLNAPFGSSFESTWNGSVSENPGYSLARLTYDFDVDSYGFIGWAGITYKYVQLQILNAYRNRLDFQITQSIIGQTNAMPVSSLPNNPNSAMFKIFNYTSQSLITSEPSLNYIGNGGYYATFTPALNLTSRDFRLDIATPEDGIWVSAHWRPGSMGRIFYLWSDTRNEQTQNGSLTQILPYNSSKLNAPLSFGQINFTLPLSYLLKDNLTLGSTTDVRLYLTSSQAAPEMTITVGFNFGGSPYTLGSAVIRNIPRMKPSSPPILETCVINIVTIQFPDQTIPAGSIVWLNIFIPGYNGRLTIYYGQPYLSQIQF